MRLPADGARPVQAMAVEAAVLGTAVRDQHRQPQHWPPADAHIVVQGRVDGGNLRGKSTSAGAISDRPPDDPPSVEELDTHAFQCVDAGREGWGASSDDFLGTSSRDTIDVRLKFLAVAAGSYRMIWSHFRNVPNGTHRVANERSMSHALWRLVHLPASTVLRSRLR
jgi:hypothetical protein